MIKVTSVTENKYWKGNDILADIRKEIQDFQEAEYGEEVRGSMISLAEKINKEVENNTGVANTAASNANNAASSARSAEGKALVAADTAKTAATNANTAAANAEKSRNDLAARVAAGEFKGDKGATGDQGPQGKSGVMVPTAGMFSLYLDPATGNLYADYPDGEAPPAFEYDAATGNLYYVTG